MNKLRKYGIILTTIITIFTNSLIVAKADTTPVIQAAHELYIPFPATSPNAYACRGVISINFDNYVTGTLTTTIVANDNIVLNFNSYVDFYCIGAEATITANETRITFHIEDEKTILLYYVCTYVATGTAVTIGNLSVDLTYKSKTLDVISHVDATDVNQISGQMATLLSTMDNIYDQDATILTRLTTLNTKTDTIISNLGTIVTALNTLQTSINNIDTQIDTISWNVINSTPYGWTTDFSTINTDMTTLTSSSAYPYILLNYNTKLNEEGLYKISLNYDSVNNFNDLNLYLYSNGSFFEIPIIYHTWERYHLNLYFNLQETALGYSSPYYWCVKVKKGQTFTSGSLSYIKQTDIEYWQLLQAIEQLNYQTEQLNLTQELIEIVSQLSSGNSTETTENITNFNTNMEIINNIEADLSVDFGTYNTEFQTQNSGNWLVSPTASGTYQQYKTLFTSVKDQVKIASLPLSLIMLCAVLLALLG